MVVDKQGKEWLITDSSDNSLQLGRLADSDSWQYREWVDNPMDTEPKLVSKDKLADWDNPKWREDTLNLKKYTKHQIEDAVSTYGYIVRWYGKVFNLEQSGYTYSIEDSIQLACECIFELEF